MRRPGEEGRGTLRAMAGGRGRSGGAVAASNLRPSHLPSAHQLSQAEALPMQMGTSENEPRKRPPVSESGALALCQNESCRWSVEHLCHGGQVVLDRGT